MGWRVNKFPVNCKRWWEAMGLWRRIKKFEPKKFFEKIKHCSLCNYGHFPLLCTDLSAYYWWALLVTTHPTLFGTLSHCRSKTTPKVYRVQSSPKRHLGPASFFTQGNFTISISLVLLKAPLFFSLARKMHIFKSHGNPLQTWPLLHYNSIPLIFSTTQTVQLTQCPHVSSFYHTFNPLMIYIGPSRTPNQHLAR